MKELDLLKKCAAEIIGTMVLVLFGCGTAVMVGCSSQNGTGYLLTALAFGLVIVAMAYSIGNVSGCHINPAVSLAMWIDGRMTARECVCYVISQCLGAITGAAILLGFAGKAGNLGANALYQGSIMKSLLIELILTFVFVLVILGVTSKSANSAVAGIVIGLSLTLVHIFGIAFTGTSVNPARSIGPALIMGGESFKVVWVFILAPLAGGALAACVHKYLIKN